MLSRMQPSTSNSGRGLDAMRSAKMGKDIWRHIIRVFLISGLYFASKRPEMHFLRHFKLKIAKWPLRSEFEMKFCAQIHFEPQNDSGSPREAFLDISRRFFFFISGLYFTQIRPEMHLLSHFPWFWGTKTMEERIGLDLVTHSKS